MKITELNRPSVELLRNKIEELLKPIEEEFNIKVSLNGGRFSNTMYNPKIELSIINDEGGIAETKERTDYKRNCVFFDLKEEYLDQSFTVAGTEYLVVGLKPRSRKYPIIAKDTRSNKSYKFGADTVRRAFKEKNDA